MAAQSKHPDDKEVLNKLTKQLKQSLYKLRNDNIEQYIKNLSPHPETDYSLWKVTKKLKISVQHSNSHRSGAKEDGDKAETFITNICTSRYTNTTR